MLRRAVGPPGVVRVALTDFRWPLDPALAEGRDETTLARALYATPLRLDPATGAPSPGLCRGWAGSSDFRRWRFQCRDAPAIAAALQRVARLRAASLNWLFAGARIAAPRADVLVVRLPFPWRRFPDVLTSVGAAPRYVAGPFRLVSGSAERVVVRRPGLTVVFRRFSVHGAGRAFERGEVDEAPIPVGDVAGTRARLGGVVHTRTLLALDAVVFRRLSPDLRRVYWQTAGRSDYAALVDESPGSAAYSLVDPRLKARPSAVRSALAAIRSLPKVRVRIAVPTDPTLRYGARLLYAQWRDVGLGPVLVSEPGQTVDGTFGRWSAAYPQSEAIPAELVLREHVGSRALLLQALGATDQAALLRRFDQDLRMSAQMIPVAWVVDARLVSPRLQGWQEDALGAVDYAGVRSPASSPRPSP